MPYGHDTFDRRIQLGASRRRREDADMLHQAKRWAGAIYLGGYAIECSLKSLICRNEGRNNLKDTRMFRHGIPGNTLHNLAQLLREVPSLQRAIANDTSGRYKEAWNTITIWWQKDHLRYWDRVGNKEESERFLEAVRVIHTFILEQQGEVS